MISDLPAIDILLLYFVVIAVICRLCIQDLDPFAKMVCRKKLHQLVYQNHQDLLSKSKRKYLDIVGSDLMVVAGKVNSCSNEGGAMM